MAKRTGRMWRVNPMSEVAALHGGTYKVEVSEHYVVLQDTKTRTLHVLLLAVQMRDEKPTAVPISGSPPLEPTTAGSPLDVDLSQEGTALST